MVALETQMPCCYCAFSILSSFFSFSFFLNLRTMLLLYGNGRDRIKTLTAYRMVFIRGRLLYYVSWPKMTKLQLFEITLNTAERQSAHCCCMQLTRSLPLHALDQLTAGKDKHVVASPALLADRRLKCRQSFSSSETLECNPLLNKSWFRL